MNYLILVMFERKMLKDSAHFVYAKNILLFYQSAFNAILVILDLFVISLVRIHSF